MLIRKNTPASCEYEAFLRITGIVKSELPDLSEFPDHVLRKPCQFGYQVHPESFRLHGAGHFRFPLGESFGFALCESFGLALCFALGESLGKPSILPVCFSE